MSASRGLRLLLVAALPAALAVTGVPTVSSAAVAACPNVYPLSAVRAGLTGTGLTVSHGTTPGRFTFTVLGVVPGGIDPTTDLIVVRADSAEISRAGGVWAGMSGSPLYADDGRLVGAIGYGLATGPSHVAGVVPAATLTDVLRRAGVAPRAVADRPAAGFVPLALPLSVSGLSSSRIAGLHKALDLPGSLPFVTYHGAVASRSAAGATPLVPGSAVATSVSYGDVTAAAIGTVTFVCNGRAVAFGHPFTATGLTSEVAHAAQTLFIQDDPTWGPYAVSTIGAPVGLVTQDRMNGVRIVLGALPTTVPVTATVTNDGDRRTGRTRVASSRFVADLVGGHLLSDIDTVLSRIGEGSALVGWTIKGRRADGTPWTLQGGNRYVSRWDVSGESAFPVADLVDRLFNNRFEPVAFTSVDFAVNVVDQLREYALGDVAVDAGAGFAPADPTVPLQLVAGQPLTVRVALLPYQGRGGSRTVTVTLVLPPDAAGEGSLDIVAGNAGGTPAYDPGNPGAGDSAPGAPTSFDELLQQLGSTPRNDQLGVGLTLNGAPVGKRLVQLGQVVTGGLSVPVSVAPPVPQPEETVAPTP